MLAVACGVIALVVLIVVVAFVSGSSTPPPPTVPPRATQDANLLAFASGLGKQFAWTADPSDVTSQLQASDVAVGRVTVHMEGADVRFARYATVDARKAAQGPTPPWTRGTTTDRTRLLSRDSRR